MQKRLAIQFYGYLRSFESCRDSFFENCVKPIEKAGFEVDIFMHTWEEVDGKTLSWSIEKIDKDFETTKSPSVEFLCEFYGAKKVKITPQIENEDTDKFVKCRGGQDYRYKSILNPYFSIFSVNSLRQQYEQENGVEYDLVAFIRADLFFHAEIDLDWLGPFNENKIFGYYWLGASELCKFDCFYIGQPNTINKIAQIYTKLDFADLQKANLFNPESILYNFCLDNRIGLLSIYPWHGPYNIKRTKEYVEFRRRENTQNTDKIISINENELKKLRNLEHFGGFVKFYLKKRLRHLQVWTRRFRYPIKRFFKGLFG